MFALKSWKDTVVRSLLIAVILFNALIPGAVAAASPSGIDSAKSAKISIATQGRKGLIETFSNPPRIALQETSTPTALPTSTATFTPEPSGTPASTPESTPVPTQTTKISTTSPDLAVEFSAASKQAKAGDQVVFTLKIANHGKTPYTGLHFSNILPEGFDPIPGDIKGFVFDEKTRELSWATEKEIALLPGESLISQYTVLINTSVTDLQVVDTASLWTNELKEPVLVEAWMTISDPDQSLTLLDATGGVALGLNEQIKISLPKDSLDSSAAVSIQDLKQASAPAAGAPALVFELGLRAPILKDAQLLTPEAGVVAENDQAMPLEPIEAKFNEPVELTVSFDSITDLATLTADQAPFLVTLDEASGVWVRMPLKSIDREANTISAELTHFSTWGVGFGPSFPTNGANVLLFDNAYPTLFTGRSKYSIPIWTPPGRNGMQPSLALSYSSGSVDGVLGDVQAPWVGMGWSIDTAEIARKITTTSAGYGYENKFMLLLNGTGYELLPDATTLDRYHTKDENFLYIQRHNDVLGSPSSANTTGEWWEVVEKDGTRWQLGNTNDSEQLAAMKGYPGTNPPTGAWTALGYAGNEANVVAGRWRVNQVTDVYGNQMSFIYTEENRLLTGTSASYNNASYIYLIQYTKHSTNNPTGWGYAVEFVTESRGANDMPASTTEWDNWDSSRLNLIRIWSAGAIVRTYDLDYQVGSYTDGGTSWQTTTLTSVAMSGSTTGTPVVTTAAPTIRFTYTDKDNRAANGGSSNEWAYPRLTTINNGWGSTASYTYANDGRPYTSWYNWKVTTLDVTDSVNANPKRTTFTYSTPCYSDATLGWCNASNVGGLIGYQQATDTSLAFDLATVRAKTVHLFYVNDWNPVGYEYETQHQDSSGTILSKTITNFTTMGTSGYPDGAYFTYPSMVDEYLLVPGTGLTLVKHKLMGYDSDTGNYQGEADFRVTDLAHPYRQTVYEYVTNPDPTVWILNTVSKIKVLDANGVVLSEQQYGYDGNLPGYTSPNSPITSKPDLSRLVNVNNSQTIDTKYVYDIYGNVTQTQLFKTYGTTGSLPTGTPLIYATTFDPLKTYPISQSTPVISQNTTFAYDYGLGLPITVKDPNDNITTTAYDGLGRVISVQYPGYAQSNVKYTYPTPSGTPLAVGAPFAVKMEIWDETASPAAYRSAWQIMDSLGRAIQTQSPYETAGTLVLNDAAYNVFGSVGYQGLPRTQTGTGGTYYAPNWTSVLHTTTQYDALQRPISVTFADGSVESLSYSGFRTTAIDRNSHQKIQEVDDFGRLTKVEEYTGSSPYVLYATTKYEYDERDLLTKVIDNDAGTQNQTTLHYNGFGRKDSMTDPDMGSWSYGYDVFGNLNLQTDARGCTTSILYDDLNRPYQKTYAGPGACATTPQVTYTYDSTVSSNEGLGRRTSMTDGSGSTTWMYNVLGQVTNQTNTIDSTNYTISGTFDAFGRPRTQTLPSTEVLTYSYNAMGALLGLSGTNTYVSQIHYSASGQVTDQLLGNGLLQQSCYDTNTLHLTRIRSYIGTIQSCVVPNPANARLNLAYGYQPNGNVSQITDATRNETLTYTYDELDRLLTGSGSDSRSYTYGATGNLISQNNALPNPGTTNLVSWWSLNETSGTRNDSHLTANHLTDNNTVTASAGKQGNAAQFTLANSEYLSIPDNASNSMGAGARMTTCAWVKLNSKNSTQIQEFVAKSGSSNGTWEYFLRYDGVSDWFEFAVTSNGSSTTQVEANASSFGSPAIGAWNYVCGGYDGTNIWVSVNAGVRNTTVFAADIFDGSGTSLRLGSYAGSQYLDGALDEVVLYKRALTSGEITWLYNNGAGRTYANLSLPSPSSTTYTYGNTAHKHAVTSLSTGETYTYDANGNMITRVENGLTYTQTFDAENRLVSVTVSGQTTQFIYDGDGNLVKKINPNGSKTIYVGGVYEVDKTSGGAVTRTVTYYPAGGAMRINSTLYYILKDHLGSASVVTDASGVTVGEQRYYPYGATRWTTGTIYTDKLYTGQREITGLGIYHYGARFYSPYINRFLSPDTIVPGAANPQAWNRYSYVLGNPLKYIDPTGHMQESDDYTKSDGKCSKGDTSCNWVGKTPKKPQPKKSKGNNGNGECSTVTCNAVNGDLLAIADLLIPSHAGWRLQAEGSLTVGPAVGFGGSGTLGLNVAFNRKSEEFGLFFDWSLEGGGGVGPPLGASVTTGPIVGWGSSTVKDVAAGDSYVISGTASAEAAVSVALSVPRDGLELHVDPVYGQIPITAYGGAGAGTPYGGAGGGISHVFGSAIIDLSPYLP